MIDVLIVIDELKKIKQQLKLGNNAMAMKLIDEGIAYREKEVKEFEEQEAPKMPMGDLANDPIKTFN